MASPWTAPGFMTTPAAIGGIGLFSLAVLGSALQGWGSENSGLRGLLKRPGFALSLLAALTATFLASRQLRHLALASLLWAPVIGAFGYSEMEISPLSRRQHWHSRLLSFYSSGSRLPAGIDARDNGAGDPSAVAGHPKLRSFPSIPSSINGKSQVSSCVNMNLADLPVTHLWGETATDDGFPQHGLYPRIFSRARICITW